MDSLLRERSESQFWSDSVPWSLTHPSTQPPLVMLRLLCLPELPPRTARKGLLIR